VIWLTWRQFRSSAAVAVVALGAVAVVLGVTDAQHAAATTAFLSHDHLLKFLSTALVAIPALLGAFWGAPLVARELETGTWRLAWSQSITRTRWLTTKVGLIGLASVATTGAFTLMLTAWSSPAVNQGRLTPAMFGERGIAPMGYAAFGFALGVTAGVLIRRTVPAMATTLVTFLVARIAVQTWLRPHFAAPIKVIQAYASPKGAPGFAAKPGDWVWSNTLIDSSGHVVNTVPCQSRGSGAAVGAGGPVSRGALDGTQAAVQSCLAHYRAIVTYEPAGRYWTFQWYETAIFVALALLAIAVAFWSLRHRRH
jgi:hypothetical protein